MNIELDDDLFAITKQLTSLEAMRGMRTKFDEHIVPCLLKIAFITKMPHRFSGISRNGWDTPLAVTSGRGRLDIR